MIFSGLLIQYVQMFELGGHHVASLYGTVMHVADGSMTWHSYFFIKNTLKIQLTVN